MREISYAQLYHAGPVGVVAAARNGHLHILRFLQEHELLFDPDAVPQAAKGGFLDCVQYLHESGCALETQACKLASEGGQLDCLKYLHDNGCPWNFEAPARAAHGNHLQCLQYLHENGCTWCEATPVAAAEQGNIECLRYALEHGCPCNEVMTLTAAAGAENYECLKYLIEERAFAVHQDVTICGEALVHARVANLKYLIAKGFPISTFVYVEKRFSNDYAYNDADLLKCIECAVAQGWKFNEAFHYMVTDCNYRNKEQSALPLSIAYLDSNLQVFLLTVFTRITFINI